MQCVFNLIYGRNMTCVLTPHHHVFNPIYGLNMTMVAPTVETALMWSI